MSSWVEVWSRATAADLDKEASFAARVVESQRRVFQIAYSVLGNSADAEEVAQEAFLRAYRRFSSLRAPEKFRPWVSRIAFRLALNRYRSRRREWARDTAWQGSRPTPVEDGARSAVDPVLLQQVRAEIDRLPEKLRVVVVLCALEEMGAPEAAAVLDIPVGTVRSRLHLARKRLLEAMTP
jgi:RNA polymerase sigma-70 factor (ECF subfamily)